MTMEAPVAIPLEDLTPRQREVAGLLVEGLSAKQIAGALYISLATARTHIDHIYARLGVNNRARAVARLLGYEGR